MRKPSKSANRLAEMIKKAIDDGKVTTTEYDKIMAIADEDSHLDQQEKRLLGELQHMISNGTVKRVK